MFQILLIFLIFNVMNCESQSPDMIVVLSRHGAREPLLSLYDETWDNPSYLMDVGVEEHYALGSILAKKYSELLRDIKTDEIYLQSTYASRTQMSVSAELYGIFNGHSHKHQQGKRDFKIPYANQTAVNEIIDDILKKPANIPNKLQFLPQKIQSKTEEDLIQINPTSCHYVSEKQFERIESEGNREMEVFLQPTFHQVQKLGYDIKNITELQLFGDALASRYSDNRPPLQGIPYEGKTFRDSVFAFRWWNIYNLVSPGLDRSLKVFPLYNRLTEWFDAKAQGKNPLKLVLLGGHESSLFSFLSLYNITNHACFAENYKSQEAGQPLPFPECQFPEVASQLIYEFYNNSGNPYVKMLYNGKPFKICKSSQEIECSLDDFIRELPEATSNLTKQKFDQVCAAPKLIASQSTFDIVLMMFMIIFGAVIGLVFYLLLSKKMVISNQYVKGTLNEHTEPANTSTAIEMQMSKDIVN